MGLRNEFLESKVMLVVYLKSLGAVELRVLSCRGVLVSEVGLHSYLIHYLSIKRILLPILYHVYFMSIGLMNMFDYIIYMLFI